MCRRGRPELLDRSEPEIASWRLSAAPKCLSASFWSSFDASWAALERSKPHSKRNLASLGRNLALEDALYVQHGAFEVDFWCPCNPRS